MSGEHQGLLLCWVGTFIGFIHFPSYFVYYFDYLWPSVGTLREKKKKRTERDILDEWDSAIWWQDFNFGILAIRATVANTLGHS